MSGALKRDEWETVRLGDVFIRIKNGVSIKQGEVGGGYPITRIETISDGSVNREKMGYAGITDLKKYEDYVMQDGDILMSHINSEKHLGKSAVYSKFADEMIIHGMNLLLLRVNSATLNNKYAYYYILSNRFKSQLSTITKKSVNQASFSIQPLKTLEILLPPLDIQRRIADTLDKVTELITLRKTQLEKLDELVKARFVEMFGDPVTNPMDWKKITVEQAINQKIIDKPLDGNHGGKHPKTSDYVPSGIPFIMANNLVDGSVDLINCAFISKKQADSLDKGFAKDGDVLITHKGTIGKTAILHCQYPYVMLTPQVTYYRPIDGIIPEYLKAYFDTDYFQGIIGNIASIGSTRAYIGITAQQELPIVVPPIELQNQFAAFVEQTDKSKSITQQSLDALETLKKSLMQEYF